MRKAEIRLLALCLPLAMLATGCGGSSGDDDKPAEDSGVPEAPPIDSDTTITGQLAEGGSQVYRVSSDAHISLISTIGDADLFIFDNFSDIDVSELESGAIYDNETVLCWSAGAFREDTCTASVMDGEMFVLIHGYSESQFSITTVTDCSTDVINEWAYRGLNDFYLYADQVPVINPADYDDTLEMIRDLRIDPPDSYSGIRDAATQSAFFEEGVQFGLGHSWRRDSQGSLRINYVFADSPFGRAGVKRGDIALTLGGEEINSSMSSQRFLELIGSPENPVVSEWTFMDGDTGQIKSISVLIGEYDVNTILYSAQYDMPGSDGRIGYIVLSNFIEPSRQELAQVIDSFNADGVSELILDLRYNGGGRSFVSRHLASQIGGSRVQGMTYAGFRHNNTYSGLDFEEQFPDASPVLGLDRVVVLTTDRTASASESLINTLRPYMDVVTIGGRSEGKAFRSYGRQFCGKTLNLMQVEGVNASGVSVAGGVPADCYAEDDLARNFGLESGAMEGMLGKGLDYLANGSCDTAPAIAMARQTQVNDLLQTNEMMLIGNDEAMPERKK